MGRIKRVFFLNIHFLFGQSFRQTSLPTKEEIKKAWGLSCVGVAFESVE